MYSFSPNQPTTMCKYAMIRYKSHYACFQCRKAFKRKLLRDVTGNDKFQEKEAHCPECGGLMANMGKDFEAPPKKQSKAWSHIQDLYAVGVTFHSCGCTGPGYIPADRESLVAYLHEQRADFERQLAFWRQRIEPATRPEMDREASKNGAFLRRMHHLAKADRDKIKNEEAIRFWIGRIQELEHRLGRIR